MSIVHYYTLCWNEEKILPFVLDYYSAFCTRLVVMDNESDDRSPEIVKTYSGSEVRSYSSGGQIRDDLYLQIKNNIWKESRGVADWVIVCDADEILYHPNLPDKLNELKKKGVTIIKPYGYDMYSELFPVNHLLEIRNGVRDNRHLRKCIIFDPNKIEEINYKAGCHQSKPKGKVRFYRKSDIKLLHYKNLELDYLLYRYEIFRNRLSRFNLENKLGKHYLTEREKLKEKYLKNLKKARPVF